MWNTVWPTNTAVAGQNASLKHQHKYSIASHLVLKRSLWTQWISVSSWTAAHLWTGAGGFVAGLAACLAAGFAAAFAEPTICATAHHTTKNMCWKQFDWGLVYRHIYNVGNFLYVHIFIYICMIYIYIIYIIYIYIYCSLALFGYSTIPLTHSFRHKQWKCSGIPSAPWRGDVTGGFLSSTLCTIPVSLASRQLAWVSSSIMHVYTVCMYAYICIYIYIRVCVWIRICIWIWIKNVYIHIYIYACKSFSVSLAV